MPGLKKSNNNIEENDKKDKDLKKVNSKTTKL